MDYAISSCYRKISSVKSDENVRLCMDMFNSVDVDTMLMKRRQGFFDGYEHLDNLLCQITMSCMLIIIFIIILCFCFIILLLPVLHCCLDDEIRMRVL